MANQSWTTLRANSATRFLFFFFHNLFLLDFCSLLANWTAADFSSHGIAWLVMPLRGTSWYFRVESSVFAASIERDSWTSRLILFASINFKICKFDSSSKHRETPVAMESFKDGDSSLGDGQSKDKETLSELGSLDLLTRRISSSSVFLQEAFIQLKD